MGVKDCLKCGGKATMKVTLAPRSEANWAKGWIEVWECFNVVVPALEKGNAEDILCGYTEPVDVRLRKGQLMRF